MKKIIIIILVVLLGVAAYYFIPSSPSVGKALPGTSKDSEFHPDPSNATFVFDDGSISLSSGKYETKITSGSALTEEIDLMDKFGYGDINQDGKNDTALLLAQYGGGSGVFIYVAAYVSGPVSYKGSDAIFIGDRIAPQSLSIDGKTITVKYLDRGPNDPFSAEPTISTTKQFIYQSGKLQEK